LITGIEPVPTFWISVSLIWRQFSSSATAANDLLVAARLIFEQIELAYQLFGQVTA
jgi:hypothetical protein